MANKNKPKSKPKRKTVTVTARIPSMRGHGKYKSGVGTIRGRGNFFTDAVSAIARPFTDDTPSGGAINRAARSLGGAIGDALPIPGAGRLLGNAGSWFARLLGQGTYSVRRNSLLSGRSVESGPNVASPPLFGSIPKGADIVLAHKEYVGAIPSSTEFAINTFPLNPGNPGLFPWLSQIATLYEEYEFLGLIMEYRSTSATAVGTTSAAMGSVMMATDYDCYDANFTNKVKMENAEFSSSGVPYQTFIHPIECDPKRNILRSGYVVPGITTASQAAGDQRMSVLGNFSIATQGQQTANTAIGELWVSYHVRLSRPMLENAVTPPISSQHVAYAVAGGPGTMTHLGSSPLYRVPFNISVSGSNNLARALIQPMVTTPLSVRVLITVVGVQLGTGWVVPSNLYSILSGGASAPLLRAGVTGYDSAALYELGTNPANATSNNWLMNTIIEFPNQASIAEIPLPAPVAGQGWFDIYITEVDQTMTAPNPEIAEKNLQQSISAMSKRLAALEVSKASGQPDTSAAAAALPSSASTTVKVDPDPGDFISVPRSLFETRK